MPHSITDGDACLAYFNKKRGIPKKRRKDRTGTYHFHVHWM